MEYNMVNVWFENIPITNGVEMVNNVRESLGLTKDEQELMTLADEMASSMAGLNAQTYDTFVLAREKFRLKIKRMVDKQQASEERIAKIKAAIEAV